MAFFKIPLSTNVIGASSGLVLVLVLGRVSSCEPSKNMFAFPQAKEQPQSHVITSLNVSAFPAASPVASAISPMGSTVSHMASTTSLAPLALLASPSSATGLGPLVPLTSACSHC